MNTNSINSPSNSNNSNNNNNNSNSIHNIKIMLKQIKENIISSNKIIMN